jgi:hypothetical protein
MQGEGRREKGIESREQEKGRMEQGTGNGD